jgi:hypothetical protein
VYVDWINSSGSGYSIVAGPCECGNESLSSIINGEYLQLIISFSRKTLLHGVMELASWVNGCEV